LHHFTGADWGGKFAGVFKKTWVSAYLLLPVTDEIVWTLLEWARKSKPAHFNYKMKVICLRSINQSKKDYLFAMYTQSVYKHRFHSGSPMGTISQKYLDGEKLPPMRGALLPHIARSHGNERQIIHGINGSASFLSQTKMGGRST